MSMKFTAIIRKVDHGCVGYVEELPGANTQGAVLDETYESRKKELSPLLEVSRLLAEDALVGVDFIR